jgi:cytochrome c oxidase subunit 3
MTGQRRALDVRELPTFRFTHQSLLWWGTLAMIVIEGTAFALVLLAYYYLRSHSQTWPMSAPPPDLLWGTVNTAVMLASLWPNHMAKKAAVAMDRRRTLVWLLLALGFSFVFLAVRVMEFATLNVGWDSNAYGSVVWLLLGLHTAHLITDTIDTMVLAALFITGPIDGRRFGDVAENCFYWYFVTIAWLPIYFTIYWGARVV